MTTSAGAAPEFSRMIDLRSIPARAVVLEPDEAERRRLAGRFAIAEIRAMRAEVELEPEGAEVTATGRLTASIVQSCAVSGEPIEAEIDEPVFVRFVPARHDHKPDEEIELEAGELDEIEYEGTAFDLGEAIAQSLALAIDPFATGPDAETVRKEHKLHGDAASGPFAALAAFKKGG
ncbi:MAG: DUF177 domain-containing protein [Sphingomonadales bacterium]|nr:DUF177 domain-containing protein [Sphingomonadales bacterium]MDE2570555.1 DUF177 domain-containing protein [Sphingomonadales bacterium]